MTDFWPRCLCAYFLTLSTQFSKYALGGVHKAPRLTRTQPYTYPTQNLSGSIRLLMIILKLIMNWKTIWSVVS